VKNSAVEESDGDLFGRTPADKSASRDAAIPFDELYVSVMSGGTRGCTEGHRPADPHRPALTAHTENIARWAARFFGKQQPT
jgi:hypothetical protein